jgi:hypothetical protein
MVLHGLRRHSADAGLVQPKDALKRVDSKCSTNSGLGHLLSADLRPSRRRRRRTSVSRLWFMYRVSNLIQDWLRVGILRSQLVQPLPSTGTTNLILETNTTVSLMVQLVCCAVQVSDGNLF